jgi:alanine racemase
MEKLNGQQTELASELDMISEYRPRHSSRIVLSQSALRKNINFIRKKIGRHPRISSVVKANAYGHGIDTFVPLSERCGIDHFATASAFEAEEVLRHRERPEHSDIMVMGILYDEDLPWVISHGIEFFVFDPGRMEKALEVAQRLNKPAKVHLEVETGTNRTGFSEPYFKQALKLLKKYPNDLHFQGLCTHLAGAESFANQFRIQRQIMRYREFDKLVRKKQLKPVYRHIACSAAALAYPQTVMDMVRVGIAQYGFWPSREIYYAHLQEIEKKRDNPLQRVISWKTNIMDIKMVRQDEFIGYGTAFQAYRDMKIAVIPLGYSNGYSRSLSNKGHVLIRQKKCPIVGLINMNLFMVDVSHLPEVHVDDEVVLIGRQKHHAITVGSFSQNTNQLNNEMLARLPAAIPREIGR